MHLRADDGRKQGLNAMEETWRWFGPDDTVTLEQIRQAGATGIVTALDHVPTGETWPTADIEERKRLIENAGLTWSVVESVPLHNDIKTRSGDFRRYVDSYKDSIRNLGIASIHRVCYNFMPVVDWTRTNLAYELPNSAQALRFEMTDFAAYDLFVLKRDGAQDSYDDDVVAGSLSHEYVCDWVNAVGRKGWMIRARGLQVSVPPRKAYVKKY